MTDHRNPESQRDLALNLISSRLLPAKPVEPQKPGWFDQFKAALTATFLPTGGGQFVPGLPRAGVQPVGMPVLHGLEWAGREGIRDPLSAAMSYASLSEADARAQRGGAPWQQRALSGLREPVDWFNMDRWGEARATPGSVGQSMMTGLLTSNIRDPAEVAAARESQLYRKGSGVIDAGLRVTVDPNAVLFGQTARIVGGQIARQGLPAVARSIRSAASQNRLGLRSPGRWLGRVDPPDAVQGAAPAAGSQGWLDDAWAGTSRANEGVPQFNTPQYLDEIRAARPETIARTATERYPTGLRQSREGTWRNAIQQGSPVLEDGYVIPMRRYESGVGSRVHTMSEVSTPPWKKSMTVSYPERGVLVQLDEAGQIVGNPIRAVGDRTPLDDIGLVGFDKPVSPNWITDSRRAGWWWVHADSAQPSSPHTQHIGLEDVPGFNLESKAFKVAMTGDEVAASKVDDLLERFDSILPDDEWNTFQVPRSMEGGVFAGTAAEGKTLQEIGEMARNGQELRLSRNRLEVYDVLELDRLRRNSLSPEEIKAIWPTVRRMYADEAVDNILTARDDMDTMRLRALFYDDPTMAADQTVVGAIHDFVDRGQRQGGAMGGLEEWAEVVQSSETQLAGFGEIRDLIVADLRAVTRKFVDDVGMPERVSVGRWQAPGAPIGASGSTFPMDPQWGTSTVNPSAMRYGTSGPGGMGGASGHRWIEAVVDPRTDIDFFMLSRTGHNFAEHEILMSPQTWAEKAVSGLGEHPTSWSSSQARQLTTVAPSDMPGLTSAQMELGPNAPEWLPRLLQELEVAGVEPDLIGRFIKAPAGAARERLADRVRSELSVGRRNLLEAEGWTNLPTPGAIRTYGPGGRTLDNLNVRDAFDQIASGKYDAADWLRFGSDRTLPTPPNWRKFMDELHDLAGQGDQSGVDFADWLNLRSTTTLKGERMYPEIQDGIVGWTVKEGAPAGKATMELLPGWQDELQKLVPHWMGNPAKPLL